MSRISALLIAALSITACATDKKPPAPPEQGEIKPENVDALVEFENASEPCLFRQAACARLVANLDKFQIPEGGLGGAFFIQARYEVLASSVIKGMPNNRKVCRPPEGEFPRALTVNSKKWPTVYLYISEPIGPESECYARFK